MKEEMMKAVLYYKKGSPEKLIYCDVKKPVPNENEVLIKIFSASVNAADYRSMKMGIIPKRGIFGADIAGIIESVGQNIREFNPGDEVIGNLSGFGFGGFAEYTTAPERALIMKPVEISFDEAAAFPMAGVTALQALRDKGNIQKGKKVLIIGVGGGVGTFALQLAKYFGAEVTGVCSTKNIKNINSLSVDFVIDYTKKDFTKSDRRYDIIIAVNGNYPLSSCKRILNSNGVYVMVGGALIQIFKSMLFGWLLSFGSKKIRSLTSKSNHNDLEFIANLVKDKKIAPIIDRRYPLEKTAEAINYLADGHAQGKVIIIVR